MTNQLFYGDNLGPAQLPRRLRRPRLSRPAFNSNASYNILFKSPSGTGADANIEAFSDTWTWGQAAASALLDVTQSGNHKLHTLMQAMKTAIGENAMMAYLAMMAVRLVELHRVLKPTGSLYLHCDPTASHDLKLVLDAVFGAENYLNEIVWKRSDAHNDSGQGAKHFGRVHDVIFRYSRTEASTYNPLYTDLPETTVEKWYRNIEPETGRRYNKADVTAPGGANPAKRNPLYEWNGITRYWRYSKERMQRLHDEGRLIYTKSGMTYQKRYLDESHGIPLQDLWTDIAMLRGISGAGERLGYPTQKPIALLERIIAASSNPGDLVLDPFCGCGTAIDAAQKLGRRWIGIDITHLAIGLVEKRLNDGYNQHGKQGAVWETIGVPKDKDSALRLAAEKPHEFQNWFALRVGGYPLDGGRKGADKGIDGHFYPYRNNRGETDTGVISVKAGRNIGVAMLRDLRGVMEREGYAFGLFRSAYEPTRPMLAEAAAAGMHDTEFGRFPRLQIVTPADLFHGSGAKLPPLAPINRRAPRVETRASHKKGAQGELI